MIFHFQEKWFKEILKTKWNSKNVCSHANFSKLASTLLVDNMFSVMCNGRVVSDMFVNYRGHPRPIHDCTVCGRLFLKLYEAKVILVNSGRQLLMVKIYFAINFSLIYNLFSKDSLFTSSHERKYVGFQLLETLLPSLSVGEVPLVFSPNLLRCLVNNASSQENYLHPAAKHLVSR